MSKISIYEVVPVPKLADKLVGTSVGGDPEDITYNFTLSELLNLFIPNIPGNTLQGVLDFGNTATQNINLTGIITTTTLNVGSTANILNSNLTGQTKITGGLYDRLNSIGTAGQVLTSTGTQVEWYTIPTVIPDLQQVLTSGNTAVNNIILTGNLSANNAALLTSTISTSLTVLGTLRDGLTSVGANNQVLSSNVTGVRWVNLPVYSATSPLLYNSGTGVFSIQQANASQNGYLSSADWITFDGKQTAISLTTTGNSGASTLVGATINVPNYTLSGLGGVPLTRTLTINGVTYNLAADRSWTIAAGVSSVTATTPLSSTGGVNPDISIQQSSSSLDGYLSSTDWLTFNSKQPAGNYITSLTGEATAAGPGAASVTLSNAAVIGKLLTGLNITGSAISSSDSILTAFGKVQNQINGLIGGVQYQGVWNAATNTPALVSSVGTQGYYYIVSVAGNTNLNGITDWQVGDWAIFNGSTWNKVDNTDLVTSVNGQVGAVSLTTDNIPEGATNLYYLDSRARAALSFAAGSGAYNSTTGVITIPTDNSQILNGAGYITLVSLSATSPLSYNNLTGAFSIQVANTTQNGYLSSTDWNTFNGKQDYLNGTGLVKSVAGTISYITDNSANWNTAYNDSIISAAVTGTATKTLTLNQQDGGTITASWSDIDTGLTSVGVSMPSAFSVANSPLTSNGTIAVTGSGNTLQYIDGTGALQNFPGLTGYVPYTGATQNVDLGEFGISAGYFQADLTPTGVLQVGRMQWNATDGTMDLRLLGNNVTLQIGQEMVTMVVNKSGVNLLEANYQVVRIRKVAEGGAQGQRLAVVLAQGNNENNSTEVIGLVTETINNNQEGFVTSFGEVKSINTTGSLQGETWVDGDILYLSSTIAGQLTNVRPVAPNHAVIVGYVVYAHANNGKIYMAIDTGYELGELHNVYAPTPTANQSIYWDTTNSRYQLNTIGGILGYTPANAATTISTTAPLQGGGDLSTNRTFSITQSGAASNGYLSSIDWNTFNNKQATLSLTTIGSSGAATLIGATLNIPNYANLVTSVFGRIGAVVATEGDYSLTQLSDVTITTPSSGQVLKYNGTAWVNDIDTDTGITSLNGLTALTQTFAVGTSGTDFAISSVTSTHTFNLPTASVSNRGALSSADWTTFNSKEPAITAGTTLQYYRGDKTFQTLNTTVVPEGTNLYYLDSRARTAISLTTTGSSGASTYNNTTGVFNIPDYGSALSGYVPTSRQLTINGTAYDLSADRSWSVGTVTTVSFTLGSSGTNLNSVVTNSTTTPSITLNVPTASAANRGALSAADWSTFNTKVGGVTATTPLFSSGGITPNITIQQSSGSQAGYLSSTDWTTFNNKQAAGNYITSLTGEATASGPGAAAVTLDNASVTAKILTGINITGGTILSTDSILTGFGKLQNQVNGLIGGSIYQGTWNANTNTPTLTSSVGTAGYYYIVAVAGTTNLNGITDWQVGDWAIFNGGVWQKVDNTDSVISVNGQTGAVSLTTDNISEGVTNLYFTNTRARAALSFVAGSGAYNSSTGAITIPTNTSQLTNGANFITLASLSGTAPISYNSGTGAISITQSGTASNGYLSSTDWNTFNNKQATLSLTTTGTSGAATLVGATLNIPDYGSALSGYVTLATAQTISGSKTFSGTSLFTGSATFNSALQATIGIIFPTSGTVSSGAGVVGLGAYTGGLRTAFNGGYTSDLAFQMGANYVYTFPAASGTIALVGGSGVGTVTSVAALTIGTSGTDLSSTVANSTTTPVITLNVPTASATNRGALSSADWTTFNNKQSALTNPVTGSGTNNFIPKFTTTGSTIGNSVIQEASSNIGIGVSPLRKLHVLSGTGIAQFQSNTSAGDIYIGDASSSSIDNQGIGSRGNNIVISAGGLERLFLTSAGNLGLGVTPSAWNSPFKAMQIGSTTAIWDISSVSGFSNNLYNDGTGRYLTSDFATIFQQWDGGFAWLTAPSGTAGNAISFTQAMTLDASGKLGLGVTPTGKLHIALPTYSNEDTDSQQAIFGVASGYGVRIGYNEAGNYGVINSLKPGVAWGNLVLQSGGGNILIGTTTNAGYKLDVSGTGRFSGTLRVETASSPAINIVKNATVDNRYIRFTNSEASSKDWDILNRPNANGNELAFYNTTDGVFALRLASTGAATFNYGVGIGVTPLAGNLSISHSAFQNVGLKTYTTDNVGGMSIYTNSASPYEAYFDIYSTRSGDGSTLGGSTIRFLTSSTSTTISATERMRITSGGNVGIGTISPSSLLHVNSTTTATQTVANFAAANYGSPSSRTYIQIGTQYGDGSSRIGSVNTTGNQSALIFQTQSASSGVWNDAMYITGGGNVLIGTPTDSGYKLDVNGTIRANGGQILVTGVNSNWLQSNQNSTNAQFQTWYASNGTTRRGYFGYPSGGADNFQLLNEANGSLGIGTNGAINLTIASTGAATFSANIIANGTSAFYAMKAVGSSTSGASYGLVVLAGTTSADYAVRVRNQADNADYFTILGTGAATFSANVASSAYTNGTLVVTGGVGISGQIFTNNTINTTDGFYSGKAGSDSIGSGAYMQFTNAAFIQANASSGLDFWTLPTGGGGWQKRMRLTNGGNFLIGTTTDSGYKLDVNGTGRFTGALSGTTATFTSGLIVSNTADVYPEFKTSAIDADAFLGFSNTGDGNNAWSIGRRNTGEFWISNYTGNFNSGTRTQPLTIASTGAATFSSSVTATSFFESSDSRLKTLIQDNYQTKGIASITPKLYTKNGKVELGYYAQDFVGVLDSAVSKGSDDMLSLSYREVLVAKVYALEQEIKELKAKMN